MHHSIDELTSTEFDVCICGSGPSGAIPAVKLSKNGFKVLLIETGTRDSRNDFDEFADEIHTYGEPSPRFSFSRQFGGSSHLWSGQTSFFEEADFELGPWPITFNDLADDIAEAQEILGIFAVDTEEQRSLVQQHELAPLATRPMDLKPFLLQQHPFNTAEYLEENANADLTISLNAQVTRLIDGESGEISSIEVVDRSTHEKYQLRARRFIVAAGGLATPRILLNSKLSNIPNPDIIGRYLSTHPKLELGEIKLNRRVRASNSILADHIINDLHLRTGVGFDKNYILEQGLNNHYVQISASREAFTLELFDHMRDHSRFLQFISNLGGLPQKILFRVAKATFKFIQKYSSKLGLYSRLKVKIFCDQCPLPENRVFLSSRMDEFGMPKINVDWTLSEKDKDDIRHYIRALKAVVADNQLGKFKPAIDLDEKEPWPVVGFHSHFMGATRMGGDPTASVTDSYGKVHGYDNLFVSGPSLFASYGFANPFYPIVVFALRLSNHILTG